MWSGPPVGRAREISRAPNGCLRASRARDGSLSISAVNLPAPRAARPRAARTLRPMHSALGELGGNVRRYSRK